MNCADVRLDEYLDHELSDEERVAVEAHLGSCAACRAELEQSRKLEAVLKKVPASAKATAGRPADSIPDADRFLQSVRARSRRPSPAPWLAAAAAVIAAAAILYFTLHGSPVNVREELAKYAQKPSADVENRLREAGPAAFAQLETSLDDRDVRLQFAAATLLFKLADAPTRDRVLARYQQKKETNGTWTLSEPGADESDDELVPVTVSMAVDGQDRWAMNVLQKLNRLNFQAQQKVVNSVVTLLHSTNVEVQRHALEIVKKLEIEFPLPAVVDLLDSPELGDEALRFLKQETKKDFGKDKQAWLKAIGGVR